MKKKALRKDFLMEIRKSLPRFLSIFFIVALGTAFYSGIQSAAPDMRYSGDAYFDEKELMHLKTVGTLGLTEKDVEALEKLEDIEEAEPAYLTDVLTGDEQSQVALRIESMPRKLNLLSLEEGRYPDKAGECLIDYEYAADMGYKVGDTFRVIEDVEEEDEVLRVHTFTVTGIGSSPLYIAFSRGNTNIGNGEIAGFVYVPRETFDTDYYMEIYLKVKGAKEAVAFQEEYDRIVADAAKQVEAIEEERCEVRYAQIKEKALEKVGDAKQELADGKKEAEEKLADAKKELEDAGKKLSDGKEELADAKQELADGKKELARKKQELADAKEQTADGWTKLNAAKAQLAEKEAEYEKQKKKADKKISQGEKELAQGKKKLSAGRKEYETQKKQFDVQKAEYEKTRGDYNQKKTEYDNGMAELSAGREQYAGGIARLEAAKQAYEQIKAAIEAGTATEEQQAQAEALREEIQKAEQSLPAMKAQLDAAEQTLSQSAAGLAEWKAQLDAAAPQITEGEKQLQKGKEQLDAAQKELDSGEKELKKAKDELVSAKKQIAAAKSELSSQEAKLVSAQAEIADGEAKILDAEREVADGEQEIKDGEEEIAENEQKLLDGQKEYEDAKKEADETIADGEAEIADAEKEIHEIKKPEWTVSDRSDLLEYTGYGENADRMRNIGRVFPVIFFLVAALISLTTMTRMVEEERIQIGTLKALGYGKAAIAAKYVVYALLATLGGSIFGVLIGEKILPFIIIRAYGIMYQHMDVIRIPYNLAHAVVATATAVFCTMIATIEACGRELQAWPAVLMRPPAPKQGKRVLIERITFLWKRLNFTWKSTIRNLFRYKKRFFMTIMGIGGCMGLLLVGFGLRDSIMDVAVLQYHDIQIYDGQIILDEDADEAERQELKEELAGDGTVEGYTEVYMKKVDLISSGSKREAYLMVMPDGTPLEEFMHFRERVSQETFKLEDDGMILTEKTAKLLGISAGGTIGINGEQKDVQIPVDRICENYMSHYAYMTETLYRRLYGDMPEYNSILYKVAERDDKTAQEAGERALKCDAALSVSYTANIKAQIDHMLGSLDSVIVVLIISAGMLAFLVLYNLNNININERKRELATLKVLGFYDNEVAEYVYRENILLTVLGSIFGIFTGIVLHRFIIVTVEVDVCMFGRNINRISFVYAILLTFVFSIIVNFAMYYKLRKIDMVESLKSVE